MAVKLPENFGRTSGRHVCVGSQDSELALDAGYHFIKVTINNLIDFQDRRTITFKLMILLVISGRNYRCVVEVLSRLLNVTADSAR